MDEHRRPITGGDAGDVAVPIAEEQVVVTKRHVPRERVRLTTSPTTRDELVDVPLLHEEIVVERVPIGRVVEEAAAPRQEGDTLVVPVHDEVLVVEKRLVLREEVRLTRVRREVREQRRVELRREEVHIERHEPMGRGED